MVAPLDSATAGEWSAIQSWPIVAVHIALMPNGELLAFDAWERDGAPTARVRPTITSAPSTSTYGATIDVLTPDAANISTVAFIRMGSACASIATGRSWRRVT